MTVAVFRSDDGKRWRYRHEEADIVSTGWLDKTIGPDASDEEIGADLHRWVLGRFDFIVFRNGGQGT